QRRLLLTEYGYSPIFDKETRESLEDRPFLSQRLKSVILCDPQNHGCLRKENRQLGKKPEATLACTRANPLCQSLFS
ncbi:MAG: hypothetical protein P8075_22000, partial [Deltaproteobacteria bacterium]